MTWIVIGVAGALATSFSVGLLVAAVLGEIGRRVSELDCDLWASLPPSQYDGASY